ncbi:MAG: hypothetical protein HY763_17260 [Planctomycetes bacterium]|nr:hypothetical protein [Planctomycetota bacterium]
MLLWEALQSLGRGRKVHHATAEPLAGCPRLPFDKRCAAITRNGKRCKGRIREGSEFCCFHDPVLLTQRKQQPTTRVHRRRNRLSHLPDGYLRRLTSLRAVGQAMDRLYREIRLGTVTPEMGSVLFGILVRLMDSGLAVPGSGGLKNITRTKAYRVRPRLQELLTRSELAAWRRAVANAPSVFLLTDSGKQPLTAASETLPNAAASTAARALTAAS